MSFLIVKDGISKQDVEKAFHVTNEFKLWLDSQIPVIIDFGKSLLVAFIIFFICRKLIKWTVKVIKRVCERANIDVGVAKFLVSTIKIALNFLLLILLMEVVGLKTGSLVALVGSAGLTIGLALQGSLSNFAGGVLILLMKPFRVGDYIIAQGNEGTVSNIDIFYTKLLTIDNKLVVIPNGTLSNSSIVNVTNEPIRRLDLLLSIHYSENIHKVKDLLLRIAEKNELVMKDYPIDVYVSSFDPSSVKIGLRMWVSKEQYWQLKCEVLEKIKIEFDENQIEIPYDQLDVNVVKSIGN